MKKVVKEEEGGGGRFIQSGCSERRGGGGLEGGKQCTRCILHTHSVPNAAPTDDLLLLSTAVAVKPLESTCLFYFYLSTLTIYHCLNCMHMAYTPYARTSTNDSSFVAE